MGRESHQIIWLKAYKSGDPRILEHYQRALKCDPQKAAYLFHQDQVAYYNDPTGSRIQYDKETDTWRGRKVGLPREKFGLRRNGDNPDSLRNTLIKEIGEKYLTGTEVRAKIETLYGEAKVKSKLTQAHNKGILKYASGYYYLWTTPPPNPETFGPETGDSKRAEYVRLYGSMPRGLKHKPGEEYARESSQVLKWMGERSGNTDLAALELELTKARRYGAVKFDDRTGETIGILTYRAEQTAAEAKQADPSAEVSQEDGPQSESGYLHYEEPWTFWIGPPGKRKEIASKIMELIAEMPRMQPRKAASWIKDKFTFDVNAGRLIDEFKRFKIGDEVTAILVEHSDGDLEGFALVEAREEERKEKEQRELEQRREREAQEAAKPPHGWPEKLDGSSVGPELIFRGIGVAKSLEQFEKRVREFIDRFKVDLGLTPEQIVGECVASGAITTARDSVNGRFTQVGYKLAQ
jgi:hypothetical protein